VVRITSLALASSLLALSSPAPAIVDAENRLPPDRAPSLMTPTEIRAYNAGLDLKHPYYIRCKKDPVVGSLVRKLRVCRTNEEWKRFAAQNENNGREILDEMSHAPINQGAPDACTIGRC
jgi:hypothetical protein